IERRSVDALIGIAAGLAADGTINQQEAEFLRTWIETHLAHLDDPVVNILYRRLADMLSDGVLDADESAELLEMLHQFTGLP
ncbi:NAD-dependent DNA ligase, partial [Mesorhizobium japonicum]